MEPSQSASAGPRSVTPGWFDDAKFGLMFSWGLFSVPAWAPDDDRHLGVLGQAGAVGVDEGPWAHLDVIATSPYAEWYLNTVSLVGSPTWLRHQAHHPGRDYYSFAAEFDAATSGWDPDGWARAAADAGARYVLPLAKHHDGYLLFPSSRPAIADPGAGGTRRDVIGDVASACRARGLTFGVYYSGGLDWSYAGLPIRRHTRLYESAPTDARFVQHVEAHWRELVERYHPAVLWNDPCYPEPASAQRLVDWYRAQVPGGVVNDRFGIADHDFLTPEYSTVPPQPGTKWEMVRGIGRSFGHNRDERADQLLSVPEAVDLLVDVVGRGGNLLLGVGPRTDGSIDPLQAEVLAGIGQWLRRNGSGVYGTRPWVGPPVPGEVSATADHEHVFLFLRGGGPTWTFDLPLADGVVPRPLDPAAGVSIARHGDRLQVTCESPAGLPVGLAVARSCLTTTPPDAPTH